MCVLQLIVFCVCSPADFDAARATKLCKVCTKLLILKVKGISISALSLIKMD